MSGGILPPAAAAAARPILIAPAELAIVAFLLIVAVAALVYLIRVGRRGGARELGPEGTLDQLVAGLAKTRARLGLAVRKALGREVSDETIAELEGALLEADVGVAATERIIEDVRGAYRAGRARTAGELVALLKDDLERRLAERSNELRAAPAGPTVVLVVGVNGAGKTTSIAKLSSWLARRGRKVLLCAGDTFRAAAVEQLTLWAERIGCDIVKGASGADPAAVAFDATEAAIARKADYLIVDTAGRLHTQQNLMQELSKIKRVIQKRIPEAPHEVLLVLDATTGQNAIAQARNFLAATDVTGLFLAKLDGTARGGIVVAIRDELHIPVKFVGLGERPGDIQPFDAGRFVDALFA